MQETEDVFTISRKASFLFVRSPINQIIEKMDQRRHTLFPGGKMQFLIGTVEVVVEQREPG